MAKYILIILSIAAGYFSAGAQVSASYVFQLESGATAKVFADSANIRLQPDIKAALVTTLPVNFSIKILKEDTTVLQAGERAAHWYLATFEKDGLQYEGYIWGANLCIGYRHRGAFDFLFGISKTEKRVADDKSTYEVNIATVKMLKNNVLTSQQSFDAGSAENLNAHSFQADDKIKLLNVDHVLVAGVSGAACGIPTYTQYLLVKDDKLIAMPLLTTVGDADIYAHDEAYVFPAFGVGSIIKRTTEYEKNQKTGKEKKTVKNEYYKWDGAVLSKVK